jgi:uncharacterized protein YlxP (DUF503 family)
MVIGILEVDLSIGHAQSLKDKRMALRSLKERLRRSFNVSVAEVEDNDVWTRAVVGIAIVSNDQQFANQVLSKIVDYVENDREVVLDDYRMSVS